MSIFDFIKKNEQPKAETRHEQPATTQVENTDTKAENLAGEHTESKPIPEGTKRVHNLILLDESGSMQSIYRPALSGVNETLQTIRGAQDEHPNQEHFVSLIAFDSGHYNQIYSNVPAAKAEDITERQYRPQGCTPLYDAMGRSITELRDKVAPEDVVLVTIITDGYENASQEYNGEAIKALVEAMKQEGWVFTYIGANQDVDAVASAMSIDNRLAFDANEESTYAMFEKERCARKKFFSRVTNERSKACLAKGYFDMDK